MQIDVRSAVKSIKQGFDGISPAKTNLAIARAINHVAAKAKTASSREIRNIYAIKAKDLGKSISVIKASASTRTGYVVHMGRPLPVRAFNHRQTKDGVSVKIGQTRKVIKRAFVQTMPSGHMAVFGRGYYSTKFNFRTKRLPTSRPSGKNGGWPNDLPIRELTTKSIPGMFVNKIILKSVASFIEREFPARFEHELRRMIKP